LLPTIPECLAAGRCQGFSCREQCSAVLLQCNMKWIT
jgi:hypothetical protein